MTECYYLELGSLVINIKRNRRELLQDRYNYFISNETKYTKIYDKPLDNKITLAVSGCQLISQNLG